MADVDYETDSLPPPRLDRATPRRRSTIAEVFWGNLALLSGIVTMPIVAAVGYLARWLR